MKRRQLEKENNETPLEKELRKKDFEKRLYQSLLKGKENKKWKKSCTTELE